MNIHVKVEILLKRLFVIMLFIHLLFPYNSVQANGSSSSAIPFSEIEQWIEEQMKSGDIPGLAVIMADREQVIYQKGFGYADVESQRLVTSKTLFELGSTSKAYTGLALLHLQEQGNIRLQDPVSTYLPWFQVHFKGEHKGQKIDGNVEITLEQLLHHTSGIPFNTIKDIPTGNDEEALQRTVKQVSGTELEFYPGEEYLYATINYDVLGLVIEQVSGDTFENYVHDHILQPNGLHQTELIREEAAKHDLATGYKYGFLQAEAYDAPMYRGNTPAGYVMTNAEDMGKWLQLQLGGAEQETMKQLIAQSHQPDRSVLPAGDGSSYAAGWNVIPSGDGILSHAGSNPNFSSHLVLLLREQVGIAVMANLNTDYTAAITSGIADIIQGKKPSPPTEDMFRDLDKLSTVILAVASLLMVVFIILTVLVSIDFARGRRTWSSFKAKHMVHLVFTAAFVSYIGYCLYRIPEVLFWDLSWTFLQVWGPNSLLPAVYTVMATSIFFSLYMLGIMIFPKKKEKPLFPLLILSFVSGFGNAIIIFSVVEALKRVERFDVGLLLYYALGIIFYVAGQKLIRNKMIEMTHTLVYEKRSGLIDNLLHTPFYKFEKIDRGEIYAALKGDTELVSQAPDVTISALTNLVTLLFCFGYLGVVNFYGLLISVLILALAAGLYFIMGRSADKLWEQSRDIQNHFFSFINDLVQGFKELSLSKRRKKDFAADMDNSNLDFRAKNMKASMKFANAFVVGELLFVLVIGAVAFLFPVIFTDLPVSTLTTFVFVFLYMTGPINALLDVIPELVQIRISWNRLNQLIKKTSELKINSVGNSHVMLPAPRRLSLRNVEYDYKQEERSFTVGPINIEFCSGEITFITGGNGSGKTSLAKLFTGLYKADRGAIFIDEQELDHSEIGEYFAHIFSDFYLFKRLYGIETEGKAEQIDSYLHLLQMKEKVAITDGEFSSLELSTGQRKRLALLLSYLEDKPFYLFDEWAADQDPQFRQFFYDELLPELKHQGKCVIAITHDDRYFHLADKVIKMNLGQVEANLVNRDVSETDMVDSDGDVSANRTG
ncbi:cyclic peptide export ABC transporter [Paenibacillus arenosi]|uniref:Cyclic peptide export ABC transporter n=1 Tax=Paenibacillus arenosi TaxID=2774142 RepID=A0ABR9ASD0_9BACL|nr:cyclic peptide export ABC transporter [Paenibacillus arenosi]MBD8496932.1 cyclic peptide export ABC transporter [Paenibacillus arenosi]